MGRDKRQRKSQAMQADVPAANAAPADSLRPWLLAAACALVVARPMFPSEGLPESGDDLPVVMLWLAVTMAWFAGAIRGSRLRLRFGWTDAAIMLLVVWYVVSAIRAAFEASPRPAVNILWQWVGVALALLMIRQLVASRREARAIVAVMIGLAVALAVVGLYQYFYEMPNTFNKFIRNPDEQLREIGIWSPPDSKERYTFALRLGAREPIATFALTNSLAGFLVTWMTMAVGIAASAGLGNREISVRNHLPGTGPPGAPHKWFLTLISRAGLSRREFRIVGAAIVAVLLMAVCLVLTKSRSGYLAALVSLGPAWWVGRSPRQGRWGWRTAAAAAAVMVAIVAVAGIGMAVGGLDYEVLAEATKSLGYRLQYWQASLAIIADHPFFGCGPGQFQDAYTAYKLPAASEEIADPHNFLLEVWANAGTPAALALITAILLFSATLFRGSLDRRATDGPTLDNPEVPPAGSDTLPEIAPTDATRFAVLGGASGLLLSLPLALTSSAPPGWISVVIALPVASVVIAALWPWIQRGRLPVLLPGVAAFVLLLNLLAAGGIGFAGVAGSLWLLVALGLNLAEHRTVHPLPRSAAFAGLAATLLAAAACYLSAYGPVLKSRAAIEAARHNPQRAGELFHAAAETDPLAAEPRTQLAMLAFARWQQTGSQEAFREFEQHQAAALERDPHSSSAWAQAGRLYAQAYSVTRTRSMAEKAAEAYRVAVEYYPTNANYRAEFAFALLTAGDKTSFTEHAAKAFEIDSATPHEDKKLKPDLADELRKHLPRKSPGAK